MCAFLPGRQSNSRWRGSSVCSIALTLVAILALACEGAPEDEASPLLQAQPDRAPVATADHVILLSLDTLRRDAVGAYRGMQQSFTPHLDAFARDAVIFEGARAAVPFTQPSHMTMFTGLSPVVHRVTGERRKLSPAIPTLAELLKAADFSTHGLVVNYWMKEEFGFGRGFDQYDLHDEATTLAPDLNAAAYEILEANTKRDARTFLFVQYFDAHSDSRETTKTPLPYWSPPQYRADLKEDEAIYCDSKKRCATLFLQFSDYGAVPFSATFLGGLREQYDRGVQYLDAELGLFFAKLEELGLYDRSLIIVTADHGEEFREHGKFLHSQPYEESIAIPLLIKLPENHSAGVRVKGLVSTEDILPTVLELMKLPAPRYGSGESLLPSILTGHTRRELLLSQHKNKKARFALLDGRYKLIFDKRKGTSLLFDLDEDPGEKNDLAQDQPNRVIEMRSQLEEMLVRYKTTSAALSRDASPKKVGSSKPASSLSKQERDSLRAMGYLEE